MSKILDIKEFFELEENKEVIWGHKIEGTAFINPSAMNKYIQYLISEIDKKYELKKQSK